MYVTSQKVFFFLKIEGPKEKNIVLSILSREGRHFWRKPYALVSGIIIGYIIITIYEVPSLQAIERSSE